MATTRQLVERSIGPADRSPNRTPDAESRAGLGAFGRASDDRLARRASRGDRRALEAIVERYQQELYRFCLAMLGRPEDAQDALQNTMVKVLRALPGEEREIALRPWLYKIARNEAIELRRTERDTQTLESHLRDTRASVSDLAEQREHLGWLLRDLDELPERQRTVLLMRELSGLAFADIGAALGTSSAVVRQSLYESRRNLEQMDLGRSLLCASVTKVLSDADGRITRRRDIRAHLRGCPDCQRFQAAICERKQALRAITPLPLGIAAGCVEAVVAGAGGGGGLAATAGAGAAQSIGLSGLLKAAATVAAVAVVGTGVERPQPFDLGAGDSRATPAPAPHRGQLERPAPKERRAASPRPDLASPGSAVESAGWPRGGELAAAAAPRVPGADNSSDLGPNTRPGADAIPPGPQAAERAMIDETQADPPETALPPEKGEVPGKADVPEKSEAGAPGAAEPEPGAETKSPPDHPGMPAKAARPETAQQHSRASRPKPEHPPHPSQSKKPAEPVEAESPTPPAASSSEPDPSSSTGSELPSAANGTGLVKELEKKLDPD